MDIIDNQRIEATFCFVDIAGYTALTETHGDEAAADLVTLFGVLLENAARQRGKVLEIVGDGALMMCPDSGRAVEMVADLVRAASQVPHFPGLRAGLHKGYVLPRGGRFFGTTLNLAARIAAQAQGGQVLATRHVADAARAAEIRVEHIGAFRPKNLTEQVELFELHVEEHRPERRIDPVCRMGVTREHVTSTLRLGDQDYWFCSPQCAEQFAANPALYLPG